MDNKFWTTIRHQLPKPGKVIRHRREYVRDWEREKAAREIEEGIDEYYKDNNWVRREGGNVTDNL